MKERSPLALIELLIMLLVFSVTSALCLQAFAKADKISDENRRLDFAVTCVQNTAEVLKSCRGGYDDAAAMLNGQWDGSILSVVYDGFTLKAIPSYGEFTDKAEISAVTDDNEVIFSVTAAWQKEAKHE